MQILTRIALIAFMMSDFSAALAFQCFGWSPQNDLSLNLVNGSHLNVVGVPMFKNENDWERCYSTLVLCKKLAIGYVEKGDVVTFLDKTKNNCGYSFLGWVQNSRVGKVFISVADF